MLQSGGDGDDVRLLFWDRPSPPHSPLPSSSATSSSCCPSSPGDPELAPRAAGVGAAASSAGPDGRGSAQLGGRPHRRLPAAVGGAGAAPLPRPQAAGLVLLQGGATDLAATNLAPLLSHFFFLLSNILTLSQFTGSRARHEAAAAA